VFVVQNGFKELGHTLLPDYDTRKKPISNFNDVEEDRFLSDLSEQWSSSSMLKDIGNLQIETFVDNEGFYGLHILDF
jgi:hypothetical protein